MRSVIIAVAVYNKVEAHEIMNEESVSVEMYDTLLEDPLGPASTIILIISAVIVFALMKIRSLFRVMIVSHFRGKVLEEMLEGINKRQENKRMTHLYISFEYRIRTFTKAYLYEITLKVPTTRFDDNTIHGNNFIVKGSLKHWHIDYRNGTPYFVIPFPVYV